MEMVKRDHQFLTCVGQQVVSETLVLCHIDKDFIIRVI